MQPFVHLSTVPYENLHKCSAQMYCTNAQMSAHTLPPFRDKGGVWLEECEHSSRANSDIDRHNLTMVMYVLTNLRTAMISKRTGRQKTVSVKYASANLIFVDTSVAIRL